MDKLLHKELTASIIGCFYEVYNELGFGFREHVYSNALAYELHEKRHAVSRELGTYIMYKGIEIALQKLDFVVDHKVVVEVKSRFDLHPSAGRQLYNYLRATHLEVGLLLHFGPEPSFTRLISSNPDSMLIPRARRKHQTESANGNTPAARDLRQG